MVEILNYEGLYSINNDGRVFALARSVINKNGLMQKYPAKELKPSVSNNGYHRVTLCKDNTTKRFLVHRLVATAFIDNKDCKPFVNHIDNCITNNSVENLEWCTHSENMVHAQKQGRLKASQQKGGLNSGIAGIKSNIRSSKLINSTQGCWKVLSKGSIRKRKHYFNVVCINCGNEAEREKSYLINNHTPNCIKCKVRDKDIV